MANNKIKTYDTKAFTGSFMPGYDLQGMFMNTYTRFLVVPVEEMYKHVHHAIPPSRSITHILIYLTDGEAFMKIGSDTYTISKGEMLIVPAGQVFSFEDYSDSIYNKGFICVFHEDIFVGKLFKSKVIKDFEFLQVWGNPKIELGETNEVVSAILSHLSAEFQQQGLGRMDIIQSQFMALLCEINAVYKPLSVSKQTAAVGLSNKFKELLSKHTYTHHMVSDYAMLLNVSPNHLNKTVKSITGKSPTKWIDEALVLEAKVLLYQTDLSISQVANDVGIADQSYFSRLFKKYEGITPVQFRKKIEMS
ncbi:MAG: AraC family transcriptional regulator [Sphingobacteriales bacterium]|nr:MAG: AraC family transcriptional regulator [Sphingobacteriales bacterium]